MELKLSNTNRALYYILNYIFLFKLFPLISMFSYL